MISIIRQGMNRWSNIPPTLLGIGVALVLLSTGLIACVSSQVNKVVSTPTPLFSTQNQNCGKVQVGPQGVLLDATTAKQETNCFWQAFQQCHAASLTFTSSGGDAATIRIFTVEKNGSQCIISDAVQDVMGPNPPTAARSYKCQNLYQKPDGLYFSSCGEDGNVVVPTAIAH